MGMIRLFAASAWAYSSRQEDDSDEWGEITNTKAPASSMAERIWAIHMAEGGIPSQSTQVSRPRSASAACRSSTNGRSWGVSDEDLGRPPEDRARGLDQRGGGG